MKKNHSSLVKTLKNTASAQLWNFQELKHKPHHPDVMYKDASSRLDLTRIIFYIRSHIT